MGSECIKLWFKKNVILPEIRVDRMTSELWAPRSFHLSYTGIEMLMF